ncbi:PHP domain protein [Actinomyces sp. oral taxon 848 str. F0332]|nr:PHP domain protein [Actinomyces sp. oral taxon 848 str. F0332]
MRRAEQERGRSKRREGGVMLSAVIDLHTHSTASDGRSTPAELMREAARAGIDVLGLTDHDTVAGWAEAAGQVEATGTALVRGMELSAKIDGISVHILGYLFDPDDERLTAHVARMLAERRDRAVRMVARLARDVPVTWEAVEAHAGAATPVGRPHIADALIDSGVVADRQEAFAVYLRPGSPYYIHHYAPPAAEAVEWISGAGGKAVMAHPAASRRGKTVSLSRIEELADAGLFGLEVDHRDNVEREKLAKLAERRGLVRTGSSDYHGTGKPNRLGENTTAREVLDAISSGTHLEVLKP